MASTREVELEIGDTHPVFVRWVASESGFSFSGRARHGRNRKVTVRVAGPVRANQKHLRWTMVRGIPRYCHDVMSDLVRWVHRRAFRHFRCGCAGNSFEEWNEPTPDKLEAARAAMHDVRASIRELAIRAADACLPKERALALKFLPAIRFRLYQRIVNDETGRLSQLAASVPGGLLFALGLLEADHSLLNTAGERLIASVIAGRPINRLLDEAMDEIFAVALGPERDDQLADLWARALARTGERKRLRETQRLLIRRAGPRGNPAFLVTPPPLSTVPEDIPAQVYANAAWYAVMKGSLFTVIVREPNGEAAAHALCRFASVHARELRRAADGSVTRTMHVLLDYMLATRRFPARNTDPLALLEESRRWHDQIAAARDAADVLRLAPAAAAALQDRDTDFALPEAPMASASKTELELRPISTFKQLIDCGRTMRHCVASRIGDLIRERAYIYDATCMETRLTVEVRRRPDGLLELGEVRGFANRDPTFPQVRVLRDWIESIAASEHQQRREELR